MKRKRKFFKLFSQINRSEEKKFKTEKKKTRSEQPNSTTYKKTYLPRSLGFIARMQSWFSIQNSINVKHYINRKEDKTHKIVTIAAGKGILLNLTHIHDKYSQQTRTRWEIHQLH